MAKANAHRALLEQIERARAELKAAVDAHLDALITQLREQADSVPATAPRRAAVLPLRRPEQAPSDLDRQRAASALRKAGIVR